MIGSSGEGNGWNSGDTIHTLNLPCASVVNPLLPHRMQLEPVVVGARGLRRCCLQTAAVPRPDVKAPRRRSPNAPLTRNQEHKTRPMYNANCLTFRFWIPQNVGYCRLFVGYLSLAQPIGPE
jgi:hypothetical protein